MSVVKTVLVKDSDTSPIYIYPRTSSDLVEYNNETVKDKLDRIKSDVPSNAVFTDTTYENATEESDGLMSKEDKKKINDYLKIPHDENDAGLITYAQQQKLEDIHDADGTKSGLFTKDQYNKLEGIEAEANKTIIDNAITNNSENPVTSKAIYNALSTKANTNHTHEINQKNISYANISGKEAIEIESLDDCVYTGLYYQTAAFTLNPESDNITINKGQYICQVLSDKTENSTSGNVIQIIYILSGDYALDTYMRSIIINNENSTISDWKNYILRISVNNSEPSSGNNNNEPSSGNNNNEPSSGNNSEPSNNTEQIIQSLSSGIIKEVSLINQNDTRQIRLKMLDNTYKNINLSPITLSSQQIEKINAIPSNPKYTDTIYENATEELDGLMSKEDKVSFNIIKNSNSNTLIELRNDGIYSSYGDSADNSENASYIKSEDISRLRSAVSGNNLTNNLKMTLDVGSSVCKAKICNNICTVNMELRLYSSVNNINYNVLPVICGLPEMVRLQHVYAMPIYLNVKSNVIIKNINNEIIRPELFLFINSDKLNWGYTTSNNITCPDVNHSTRISDYQSPLLYINNSKEVTLHIFGTYILK